ncbi:MAG: thioredoxin family protein [Bacteroidia bacterium]|nr:thioredoxin family protein [Bacteroidia bacterium]
MKSTSILLSIMLTATITFAGGYKLNDDAQDFVLKNIDGRPVTLKDYKEAKGFIVIFTCNHCPFSVAYEDRIIALNKKYEALGYPVIAINPNDAVKHPDDSYENMIVRAREKKFNFPYLHDESQEVAKAFGATRTPHVYVLQKAGSANVVKYIGAIDNNSDDTNNASSRFVEDAVDALVAGQIVKVSETKAIGCSIKWKEQK